MAFRFWVGIGAAAIALLGCGGDSGFAASKLDAAGYEQRERAFVEALKPRREGRPVIVVLARNAATEITDFLLTHAVLRYSGVADVQAVAERRGRVSLYPAFDVEVNEDFAGFDQAHPDGADYVVVPAMGEEKDVAVNAWLKKQADMGARVIGVCVGGVVVGRAGLLDRRRFVTHWFYRKTVLDEQPSARFVPHQRYVFDQGVATTTGITASVPTMTALVEAIGGREKAQALAAELGVDSWSPAHDSSLFGLNGARRWNYILTKLAFWNHEHWNVDVQDGMDDISLAFATDAWSRTGRVSVTAAAAGPVKLRSGLKLLAKPAAEGTPRVPLSAGLKPVQQLDRTLCEIGERFGDAARDRVEMELEYAGHAGKCET